MKWAYGVTTVPERINNGTLSHTIESLTRAGFDTPHLFIDDYVETVPDWLNAYPLTVRGRRLGIHANWVLSLTELLFLHPDAERFAIFQDDIVIVEWAKEYLESCRIPEHAYLNLFTHPSNFRRTRQAWYPAKHRCRGAQALVFSCKAVRELLCSKRIMSYMNNHRKGEGVDIVISQAMKDRKHRPFVHNPSLVKRLHTPSTVGHNSYSDILLED